MLKLKYLFENFELAKTALENWDYDADTLDKMLGFYRISSNAVYPFKYQGKLRILRLSPAEEKIESNLIGELEFIDYLVANGYNANKIIPSHGGEKLLTLDTEWGKYYACCFDGVSGERLDRIKINDKIAREYGRALGRLHTLSAKYQPKTKKWSYTDVLEWIGEVLTEFDAPTAVVAEKEALTAELNAIDKTAESFGLVHYDFEPDNIFYDNKSGTISVIDFEDGMYHFFAADLYQTFNEIGDNYDEKKYEKIKKEFLNGYREERDLSDGELTTLPLMKRFVDLYGYARILRSASDVFEEEPDWLINLRLILSEKMDNFEDECAKMHS